MIQALLCPALVTLLAAPAQAGEYLVGLDETVEVGSGGNWARMFDRDEGGFWFLSAGGGEYYAQELTEAYELAGDRIELTGETFLIDHAFTRCPDGSWLHVASANLDDFDDSAYIFRYDSDFTLLGTETIAERDSTHSYNDAPVICTGDFDGSPFQPHGEKGDTELVGPFYWYDDDLSLVATLDFPGYPAIGGSSLLQEPDGTIAWIRAYSLTDAIEIQRFEDPSTAVGTPTELEHIETIEVLLGDLVEGIGVTYWPQGAIAIGDYYAVAHLGHSPDVEWISDSGNVFVQIFDSDWEWVEAIQVTEYESGSAAGQPFLHWTEGSETLQVLYSVDVQPILTEVLLNAEAFGFEASERVRPTADAGPDQDATVGDLVTLDGSGSTDDAGISTWSWTFTMAPSGTGVSDASLSAADAAITTFTPDSPGLYGLRLTVTDATDLSDTDDVVINVAPSDGGDGGAGDGGADGGVGDGGAGDGGVGDGGAGDGGSGDGGFGDGGSGDGGAGDGGSGDGGSSDGGSSDGGSSDGGADGGSSDGGSSDAGAADGGSSDGGATDGGASDGGGDDDDGKKGCATAGASPSGLLAGLLLPLLVIGRRRRA